MSKTHIDFFDPMVLLEIEGLARDGFDDCQIAEILGITPETFCRNKNKKQADGGKSQLKQSVERGRRPLSVLVENAMYKRAVGGAKIKTIIRRWIVGADGKQTDIEIIQETETELAADVTAGFKWLQVHKSDMYNIQPERIDITSGGKEIRNEAPRIGRIEHVTISSDQVKKQEAEV